MGGSAEGMSGIDLVFLVCAAFGGLLFLVRFLAGALGVHGGDADIDVGNADVVHTDPDVSFKLLSLQGLTAFFVMFGLVGFALSRGSGVHRGLALLGACAAGLGTTWVIGKLFAVTAQLQSSGTVDNDRAIGEVGTVYLTIPAEGPGKVQVNIAGRLREFEAVSASAEELRTGTPIRVLAVNGSTLIVEKTPLA